MKNNFTQEELKAAYDKHNRVVELLGQAMDTVKTHEEYEALIEPIFQELVGHYHYAKAQLIAEKHMGNKKDWDLDWLNWELDQWNDAHEGDKELS